MQLQLISKETIKPSSPTPPHLRNYKLSFLDQCYPRIYIPVVLFYPNEVSQSPAGKSPDVLAQLKNSLSEILTHYYPLAGRITDGGLSVDCNDEGVEFFEARTGWALSDTLKQPNDEIINLFFPGDVIWNHKSLKNLLFIQICSFSCGAKALAVCMSHKFADATTLTSFLNAWATVLKQPKGIVIPQLISASVFPPNGAFRLPEVEVDRSNSVRKRFVFNSSKLADLKTKKTINPTRVEVVIEQIYKSAKAASESSSGSITPSVIIQNMNLRKRMVPPLPETTVGNLVSFFPVLTNGKDLDGLVDQMRVGMTELCGKYAKTSDPEKRVLVICESFKGIGDICSSNKSVNIFQCSSWCKLPLYEVDFGRGKPIWVGLGRMEGKNTIVLTDTKGGDGIEAWVTLKEQEMAIFECDEELLSFASLNPSALDTA